MILMTIVPLTVAAIAGVTTPVIVIVVADAVFYAIAMC
jgi:hypothetical protein